MSKKTLLSSAVGKKREIVIILSFQQKVYDDGLVKKILQRCINVIWNSISLELLVLFLYFYRFNKKSITMTWSKYSHLSSIKKRLSRFIYFLQFDILRISRSTSSVIGGRVRQKISKQNLIVM